MNARGPAEARWPPPAAAIAAAVVATSSEFWAEAAELWSDLALWRLTAAEAWPFAAEAALRCGGFGLADQMLARSAAAESLQWLAASIATSRSLRALRTRHFTSGDDAGIERLLELALYRDAIRAIALDTVIDEAATRDALVRAHHGLGEHDLVCEIGRALDRPSTGAAEAIARSQACVDARTRPFSWHRDRFDTAHPRSDILNWFDS